MVIAHQPAGTAQTDATRLGQAPSQARRPHGLVPVEDRPRWWTLTKIAALIAITAFSVTLCAAVVGGGALLTIMSFR
ncbi:MAG: hypothetical protein ACLPVY_01510 [Acidimicrobiia bacterium]